MLQVLMEEARLDASLSALVEAPAGDRSRERQGQEHAAVQASDVPTHHTGGEVHVFAHDLLNAYHQWPVKQAYHDTFSRAADALQLLT